MIAYVLRFVVRDEVPSRQIANSYLTGSEQVNYSAVMRNMELL
jgi:hypothetical protein